MTLSAERLDALEKRLLEPSILAAYGPTRHEAAAAISTLRSENERLRGTLSLSRTVLVTVCGDKAPYIKIVLERIDAALAPQEGP
jgi:hypothetical protein